MCRSVQTVWCGGTTIMIAVLQGELLRMSQSEQLHLMMIITLKVMIVVINTITAGRESRNDE